MDSNIKQFLQMLAVFVYVLLAIACSSCAFSAGGFFFVVAGLVNLLGAGVGIYLYLNKNKDKL